MTRFGRALLVLLMVAFTATPLRSQEAAKDGTLALLYDVDSTSLTYCSMSPSVFGPPSSVQKKVSAAASTTLAATTAGTFPFAGIVVGDVLVLQTPTATNPSATTIVVITAKASNDSVTVDTAITVTGVFFGFYHPICGTTDNDGWVSVGAGAKAVTLGVQYNQGDLTAFVVRFEHKTGAPGASPTVLYPGGASNCGGLGYTLSTDRCSAATPGILARLEVTDWTPSGMYRVGVAFTGADASDATTNREKVNVLVSVR